VLHSDLPHKNAGLTEADLHMWTGIAVVASSLVAGFWGAGAWVLRRPAVGFWYAIRAMQALILVQILLGTVLLLAGREPPDGLHYVYGLLPLLVSFLGEGARAGVADRELQGLDFDALPDDRRRGIALAITRDETGIMTLSALVIFGLALRAATVGGG
jgi:hypothetical protein